MTWFLHPATPLRRAFARGAVLILACVAIPEAPAAESIVLNEGQQLAHEALRLEFNRDGVTASDGVVAERFRTACARGYSPACERPTWVRYGRPDLQFAGDVFEGHCSSGDPLACLVRGWAIDAAAPTSEDRDRTWRQAARLFKLHCDSGFVPACHEYAWFLLENKGLKADPRAAPLRWKPACESGFQASCTTLGSLEIEGVAGVRRDPAHGTKMLEEACKAGFPEACYRWGEVTDEKWDDAKRHTFYSDLCAQGHRESCWRLGLRYLNGASPPPTPGATQELMVRGCELDHSSCCYEAGRKMEKSGGAPNEAAGYFERACDGGDTAGCNALVELILDGRYPGSVKTATRAFESACNKRNVLAACTALAEGLLTGVDLPRDPERARGLLHRACTDADSDPVACRRLAESYEDGLGGERDRTEAAKYFRWACYKDDYIACYRRGKLLTTDMGVRRDDRDALSMFQRACTGGVAEACYEGAVILDEGTYVPRDAQEAAKMFETACSGDSGNGCAGYGRMLEKGEVAGSRDYSKARDAYARGIAAGSISAMRRNARLLWSSLGGKRDRRLARELCARACQGGDPVACRGPEFLTEENTE